MRLADQQLHEIVFRQACRQATSSMDEASSVRRKRCLWLFLAVAIISAAAIAVGVTVAKRKQKDSTEVATRLYNTRLIPTSVAFTSVQLYVYVGGFLRGEGGDKEQ